MSAFLGTVWVKILGVTASLIVLAAVHVPPLMHYLQTSDVNAANTTVSIPIKPTATSTASPESPTPSALEPVAPVTSTHVTTSANLPSGYPESMSIASDCPAGTRAYLAASSIVPTEEVHCLDKPLPVIYKGKAIDTLSIMYGREDHGDFSTFVSTSTLLLPSGVVVPDTTNMHALPGKLFYYAASKAGYIFGASFPHESRLWGSSLGAQYVSLDGNIVGPNADGNYCGTYNGIYPVVGAVVACGQGDYDSDAEVNGSLSLAGGVYPYLDAVAKGEALVNPEYLSLGVTQNYLHANVSYWVYRSDLHAWLLVFYLDHSSIPGAYGTNSAYTTSIAIKVTENGDACIAYLTSYTGSRINLLNGDFPCITSTGPYRSVTGVTQ